MSHIIVPGEESVLMRKRRRGQGQRLARGRLGTVEEVTLGWSVVKVRNPFNDLCVLPHPIRVLQIMNRELPVKRTVLESLDDYPTTPSTVPQAHSAATLW